MHLTLDQVAHWLSNIGTIVTAVASLIALARATDAKATSKQAVHEAKDAAREQLTFTLRDFVRSNPSLVTPSPAEEAGPHA